MKPGTCGRLLLSIHNNSSEIIRINVGERIAVIMFHQLLSKAKKGSDKNHVSPIVLGELGIRLTDEEGNELSKREYNDPKEMASSLKESDEFKNSKSNIKGRLQSLIVL